MGLLKTHEYRKDPLTGLAELVRENPIRAYGWAEGTRTLRDGSVVPDSSTQREVVVQAVGGNPDDLHFYTSFESSEEMDIAEVPSSILDDLQANPLVGNGVRGKPQTVSPCMICHNPWPSDHMAKHLEEHIRRGDPMASETGPIPESR